MFILYANKTQLTVRRREPVTSGSANVYEALFEFSADWEGLKRTAVFQAGTERRSVLLDESGQCAIPWEVLAVPGLQLTAGVYGTGAGETVLPTVWASLGTILEGAAPGENARPPTPDLWEQELDRKADRMDYTEAGDLGLFSGDKLLSAVPVSGCGAGGVSDHRLLTGRDAAEQHPIDAITGLADALKTIPRPMTADELRKILLGGTNYARK